MRLLRLLFVLLFALFIGATTTSKNVDILVTHTVVPNFTGLALSGLNFVAGTGGPVGTASATVSVGSTSPVWSIKTSGVDSVGGAICNNYGADFSIASGADGATSTAPNGPALTTADGIWAWGAVDGARPGEYFLNLNGAQAGIGVSTEVANGGKLYVDTASLGWFVYNSGFVASAAPGSQPAPGLVTASASAPAQNYPGVCLQATDAGQSNSPYSQAFTLVGTGGAPPSFTSVAMSGLGFSAGVASNVGTATATLSSGSPSPAWAIQTSGADHAGATCNNYGADFSVAAGTGVVSASASAPVQSYPGVCLQATQAGVANSPYTQAFTFVGSMNVAGLVTTFTFQNDTGVTLTAGSPISFGQGFRYGDIIPGQYPLIRDASTHVALPGQQWDEISTWRENGGNGSWRHAVWAIWLPQDLPSGALYTVEFVPISGTYAQISHQPLSALCSGPAAHDLKIHRTDVRNQDDTVRDSGDATFRLCDNIANVGRDAPRHLRAGNVYDEYEVSGVPVYTSGHKDPLLYDKCIVDIFTQASDGVSAGDVKWVCHDINAWMNVAAGSVGNPGSQGPVGFANDPQAITARVEIDDGASNILDWSGLDATISSASNPIQTIANAGCDGSAPNTLCMSVPSSTGPNAWFEGQSVRASCSATCVAGLTNGQLYYVYPGSSVASGGTVTNQVALIGTPYAPSPSSPMTSSQGTGTTTFSTVLELYHWEAWQTLDWTGLPNWSTFGTTSRVTRKVYPSLTMAEKRYWEETGLILPMDLTQAAGGINPSWGNALGFNYEPMSRGLVIGGQGPGPRPDIGACGEFACQAFLTETQLNWDQARRFTLGTSMHGAAMFLDEATGRIPPLNNGPPTGPGGNGTGGSYAGLGALYNQVELYGGGNNTPQFGLLGIADIPHASPELGLGPFFYGTYISHVPNFAGFTYIVFGDRFFLDLMRWRANASFAQQRVGPGPELGEAYYRDNNAVAADSNTYHYYGLLLDCCQTRGLSWMWRDILYATTFGSDTDIERSYFHDIVKETSNYYPLWEKFKDGPGNSNYSTSVIAPNNPGPYQIEAFQVNYLFDAAWFMTVWLHEPLAVGWAGKFQRFQEGCLGGQLAGAPVSFYCVDYVYQDAVHTSSYPGSAAGGHVGTGLNGVDLSDFGSFHSPSNVGVGGQLSVDTYTLTAGDTVFELAGWIGGFLPIDQLSTWHTIMSPVDNTQQYRTYYVQCTAADHITWPTQCPVAGQAFTGFTTSGAPFAGNGFQTVQIKYRLQFDPGALAGYVDANYDWYTGQINNGLQILGYDVASAQADFLFRVGTTGYNPAFPSTDWDPSVVIPGLPAAVNSIP